MNTRIVAALSLICLTLIIAGNVTPYITGTGIVKDEGVRELKFEIWRYCMQYDEVIQCTPFMDYIFSLLEISGSDRIAPTQAFDIICMITSVVAVAVCFIKRDYTKSLIGLFASSAFSGILVITLMPDFINFHSADMSYGPAFGKHIYRFSCN